MTDKKSPYLKGAVWFGLVFLLTGGAVMILSVTIDMVNTTTPRWSGILFGLMFFNAGIAVELMDSGFNDYGESNGFHIYVPWHCYQSP